MTTGTMSKSHQNRVRTKKRRSILEDDFRNGLEAVIGPVSQHVLSFGPLVVPSACGPAEQGLAAAGTECFNDETREDNFVPCALS